MAVAHVFNNVTFVFGGTARQEVSMLAEKRLQIRRQQFTEAGCRAADVGLHKYGSTKRIHRSYALLICSLPHRSAKRRTVVTVSAHFIDYFATQCLIGWRHCVVVEVHVTVGFGPQANAPGDG